MSDEQKELALRLYNDGYHAGHHDTVEGIFSDDIHGADAEYYHGEAVSEILREDEKEKGRCQMSEKQEQQQPVPCPSCGNEWQRTLAGSWGQPTPFCGLCRVRLEVDRVESYNAACAKMREKSVGTGNVIVPIAAVDGMIDAARTTQRLFSLSDQHSLMRAAKKLETEYETDSNQDEAEKDTDK